MFLGLFSNIFLTRSMFSSERVVLYLPEFSLFLLRLIPCERYFLTLCWIVFLQGGAILSPEPSNYDPLLVYQFPNYHINKRIVLSNQQLVTFYEGYVACKNFRNN